MATRHRVLSFSHLMFVAQGSGRVWVGKSGPVLMETKQRVSPRCVTMLSWYQRHTLL